MLIKRSLPNEEVIIPDVATAYDEAVLEEL